MRRAIIKLTPPLLGQFLYSGTHHFIVESGLPDDAKFISAWFQLDDDAFHVLYESESFKDIPEGCCYPYLPLPDHHLLVQPTSHYQDSESKPKEKL